jgi:hypothetical protein
MYMIQQAKSTQKLVLLLHSKLIELDQFEYDNISIYWPCYHLLFIPFEIYELLYYCVFPFILIVFLIVV